jgi:hypothetical protein
VEGQALAFLCAQPVANAQMQGQHHCSPFRGHRRCPHTCTGEMPVLLAIGKLTCLPYLNVICFFPSEVALCRTTSEGHKDGVLFGYLWPLDCPHL